MVERIPTGIEGLDNLIEGGIPKGSIVLISGTPGTGKSIFCAQILYFNALNGKKCLYLNLEQNEGRLEEQMKQFGWDLSKVSKNLKEVAIDSSEPEINEYVLKEIQTTAYDLIAFDSLDSISVNPVPIEEVDKMSMEKIANSVVPMVLDPPNIGRLKLKKIFSALAKSKATALLTSEKVKGTEYFSRDSISEFLSDGIISLELTHALDIKRQLTIEKLRGTNHSLEEHPFEINKKGIVVKELR